MKIELKSAIRIILILLFLIVFGNAVVSLFFPFSEFTFKNFISNSIKSILIGGSMAIGLIYIVKWLDKKHPWLKNPRKRLILQIVSTIGYSMLIIGIVTVIMIISKKEGTPAEVIFTNSIFMIKIAIFILTLSMLITSAFLFFVNWKKSVIMQEQLKREQLALQYETLKNQVNPHFLFNSLNSITSLIKKDPDKAILFVKKLSEVFRYVLKQKDNEISSIDEELIFLESYIFLEKIRFGENLNVYIDVKEKKQYIIPLSLQMLVENAIKHNVISKEFPLTISIYSKNENYIAVTNNLKRKHSINTGKIGLKNIKSRFEFFTSNPLIISENESNFTVEIPVIKK
jgi:hypothetical protein